MVGLYKRVRRVAIALLLLAIAVAAYAIEIEPNWAKVNHISVQLPHLDTEFQGYRIVHISDIHLGRDRKGGMPIRRLHRFIDRVNQLDPDLVAITGDFFSRTPSVDASALQLELQRLQARDRVVAVLGNHDHWFDPQSVRTVLSNAGVLELNNRVYTLNRNGALLNLAGVDDVWQQADDLDRVLSLLPPTGASILLVHEPDFADTSAAADRFDLQLSGHSHGGQIRLPFLPPLKLPYLAVKYPEGMYRLGDMQLYTNVGLGTIALPARLFCRPEITAFTLVAEAS
ncbi:metallophosphoesterase [Synechococcus sp. PCC 7336]|uniref:metallophosphoesterase n=1 Tax=Synechococcus sp. PCC 7336 TaxID=195250 RepID=UPI00034A66FE|nr:metallophosphoesterase [Synechococcus sp. PCC 7336]